MNGRVVATLLGLVVSAVSTRLGGDPALAQALPLPPSTPGLADLVSNPAGWLTTMFNAAVVALGQKTTADMVGFMNWLMGSGNVISQTPPVLSYANPAVADLWAKVAGVADVGLGVATLWGGFNVMIHPHTGAPYHGALELVPRVLLSGVMINTSLHWGRFVIDANNALCQGIGGGSMPGWDNLQQAPTGGEVLVNLIGLVIYLVMGLLLLGQMLMRLALVDALLVIAPLALLCWVLPQTYSWARLWFTTFFATVFVQAIQVLVLRLGAELMQQLPALLPSVGSDPANAGHLWVATLLVGMAILQLTRKIPRLLPGTSGGMGGAWTGPNIRQLRDLFNSRNTQKGNR